SPSSPAARRAAARARRRFSLGTYQDAKIPNATPHAQVQIHQRWPAGRLSRMMSRTTSATAHAAVPTQMTTWSFASSGGGGERRSAGALVSFILPPLPTPPGYDQAPNRDVLSPRPRPADEGNR